MGWAVCGVRRRDEFVSFGKKNLIFDSVMVLGAAFRVDFCSWGGRWRRGGVDKLFQLYKEFDLRFRDCAWCGV